MKLRESFKKKINSSRGESIAETLIALLISSLALVMLAGSISAASRIVSSERTKLKEYYAKNEAVAQMGSGTTGQTITIRADGSSDDSIQEKIVYFENDTFSGKSVISYRLANDAEQ